MKTSLRFFLPSFHAPVMNNFSRKIKTVPGRWKYDELEGAAKYTLTQTLLL